MNTNTTTMRLASKWAAAAGLAWLVLGAESIIRPDAQDYRDIAFLIPWCLTLAGMVTLHRLQRGELGRVGRTGYVGVVASMVAVIVGSVPLILGVTDTHFMLAVPMWVLTMAVYGGATARAGVVPRWIGVALALTEPITIATGAALSPWVPLVEHGSFSGAVAHGVIFLGIARVLAMTPAPDVAHLGRPALEKVVA